MSAAEQGLVGRLVSRARRGRPRAGWTDVRAIPAADQPTPEVERSPRGDDGPDWDDLGGTRPVPGGPVELPDSRVEPGGVPVRVDPAMVNPATAERMKPRR